jgi:hypothetical protein
LTGKGECDMEKFVVVLVLAGTDEAIIEFLVKASLRSAPLQQTIC